MKYKITQALCWYNKSSMIVRMYFINEVPFTFDDLPDEAFTDPEVIAIADKYLRYEPEDLYKASFYLIDEECHPCLFELDLENPQDSPCD
jgi:hypothetical protein